MYSQYCWDLPVFRLKSQRFAIDIKILLFTISLNVFTFHRETKLFKVMRLENVFSVSGFSKCTSNTQA